MKSSRAFAIASLLLVMSIWGSAFTVTKAAIAEVPPVWIALLRFVLAALVLLPFALLRRRVNAPRLRPGEWAAITGMGLCGFSLYQAGSNLALAYTSAALASIIQSIIPVITVILAMLVLRERPSGRRIGGIALSLLGVALVVLVAAPSDNASDPLFGGLLMLAVMVLWAVYTILAKRVAAVDQLTVTAYSTAIGALGLVPLALIESGGALPPAISAAGWLSIAYLGLISSATANLLYNRSLTHLDASQAATFINLVPIVGVAVAVLFLGEPLLGWQIAGGALTLVGVWLTT